MSLPVRAAVRAAAMRTHLAHTFPWTRRPLLVGAPMRVLAGPALAVAISNAGGLGFIGPGLTPDAAATDLAAARALLAEHDDLESGLLRVGYGFQVWNGDLESAAAAVGTYRPCAVWLFAPRDGQRDLAAWTRRLRSASPGTQIWVQVGTLTEAMAAATDIDSPDVLVLQGAEAGGHGRAHDGIGLVSLLPEVADALLQSDTTRDKCMALVAAGGIADARGVLAAAALGAAGSAMGTRFLAATEARIDTAYQAEVVRASDGATSTGRTQLYNHLRGTHDWPSAFSPRGLRNQTWADHQAGVPFDTLQARHDDAVKEGGTAAWGPNGRTATYAGASVGLVRDVKTAAAIVADILADASSSSHCNMQQFIPIH